MLLLPLKPAAFLVFEVSTEPGQDKRRIIADFSLGAPGSLADYSEV
jgi:hypothetical protein